MGEYLQRQAITGTVYGLESHGACVWTCVDDDRESAKPSLRVKGLGDAAGSQMASLVKSALTFSGFSVPRCDIVVEVQAFGKTETGRSGLSDSKSRLWRSEQRESAHEAALTDPSALGLPIALTILAATGQVPDGFLDGRLFVGRLAPSGAILPVRGVLAYEALAQANGLALVTALDGYGRKGRGLSAPAGLGMATLKDAHDGALQEIAASEPAEPAVPCDKEGLGGLKLAAMACALTLRPMLLRNVGEAADAPWAASVVRSLLSAMATDDGRRKARLAASVAGLPDPSGAPLRAPEGNVTVKAMTGSGSTGAPGELTLASGGVMFLDDATGFLPSVLDATLDACASWQVSIGRGYLKETMPAAFALVMHDDDKRLTGDRLTLSDQGVAREIAKAATIDIDLAGPVATAPLAGCDRLTVGDMCEIVARERRESPTRRWDEGVAGAVDQCEPEAAEALMEVADTVAAVLGSETIGREELLLAAELMRLDIVEDLICQ